MEKYLLLTDGRVSIIKMHVLPKAVCRCNATPSIPRWYFSKNWNNSKICREPEKTPKAKAILRKKNKAREITVLDFESCYQPI